MKNNRESGYFLLYQEIVMQFLHDKKCRLHDDPPFFNRDRLYSSHRTEHMGPVFEGKENKRMEETKMNMSLIVVLAIMGVLAISYLGAKKKFIWNAGECEYAGKRGIGIAAENRCFFLLRRIKTWDRGGVSYSGR